VNFKAFFGMNNIQDGSVLSSSWVPFGYILTTVCLATYLITLVSIWWVGWINMGQGSRERFKQGLDRFFERLPWHKTPENASGHGKTDVGREYGGDLPHPVVLRTGPSKEKQVRDSQLV
jgi:hypothetical protein